MADGLPWPACGRRLEKLRFPRNVTEEGKARFLEIFPDLNKRKS